MLYAFHVADPALSGFDCARLLRELLQSGAMRGVRRLSERSFADRWQDKRAQGRTQRDSDSGGPWFGPIPERELAAIAAESSESERRADDAERELMEWKKIKFMQDRVGEDFGGMILNATKYGLFVELDDLFVEGLVPLQSLGSSTTTAIRIAKTRGRLSGTDGGGNFQSVSGCGWFWIAWMRWRGGCSFRFWTRRQESGERRRKGRRERVSRRGGRRSGRRQRGKRRRPNPGKVTVGVTSRRGSSGKRGSRGEWSIR